MATYRVTPSELDSAASFLQSTSGEIDNEVGAFTQYMNQTTAVWKGQANLNFDEQFAQLRTGLTEVNQALSGIATLLQQVAANYTATETANTKLFS